MAYDKGIFIAFKKEVPWSFLGFFDITDPFLALFENAHVFEWLE